MLLLLAALAQTYTWLQKLLLYCLQLHPTALSLYNNAAALLHLRYVHQNNLFCVLSLQAVQRVYKILTLFQEGKGYAAINVKLVPSPSVKI